MFSNAPAIVQNRKFMPVYRVFYLKDSEIERFREMAPKAEPYHLKPRCYEESGHIEASNVYAAWQALQEAGGEGGPGRRMGVGDALQAESDVPQVCTFWGFEPAIWQEVVSGAPAGYEGAGSASVSAAEESAETADRAGK
jgi:hypothetical protein